MRVDDDRAVDVHGALRRARRAAREVEQRDVLRIGRPDLVLLGRLDHQPVVVERSRHLGRRRPRRRGSRARARAARRGSRRPCARRAAAVVTSTFALPIASRVWIGSGPNCGEQRAEDAAVLERAERRDVQLGDPPGEHADDVALADPERGEHVREAVGQVAEVGVGEVAHVAVLAEPAHREVVAHAARSAWRSTASWAMFRPRPSGSPSSVSRGALPEAGSALSLVVEQVGLNRPSGRRRLGDRRKGHLSAIIGGRLARGIGGCSVCHSGKYAI